MIAADATEHVLHRQGSGRMKQIDVGPVVARPSRRLTGMLGRAVIMRQLKLSDTSTFRAANSADGEVASRPAAATGSNPGVSMSQVAVRITVDWLVEKSWWSIMSVNDND